MTDDGEEGADRISLNGIKHYYQVMKQTIAYYARIFSSSSIKSVMGKDESFLNNPYR